MCFPENHTHAFVMKFSHSYKHNFYSVDIKHKTQDYFHFPNILNFITQYKKKNVLIPQAYFTIIK